MGFQHLSAAERKAVAKKGSKAGHRFTRKEARAAAQKPRGPRTKKGSPK